MKLKKIKSNRWLMTLFVLILGVGLVGVANAATMQQSIADMIKNDPNPMVMNMNTDPAAGTNTTTNTTQPAANSTQPATNSGAPAQDGANAQNTQQPAVNITPADTKASPQGNGSGGQNNAAQQPASGGKSSAPASQNDLYNQMLQACLQMGGQMMKNCPMLNGSNMTPEQMIKACLQMQGQMMQSMNNMSQQDFAAMQQACQQYYNQGQKSSWNAQNGSKSSGNNNGGYGWGHENMSGGWSGMGHGGGDW